jgi:hypothetical protein
VEESDQAAPAAHLAGNASVAEAASEAVSLAAAPKAALSAVEIDRVRVAALVS